MSDKLLSFKIDISNVKVKNIIVKCYSKYRTYMLFKEISVIYI